MKKLVIVESPTKAKTISKFLPDGYVVKASQGHIRDLPRSATEIPAKYKKHKWSSLGVNVEKDYDPIYVIPQEKKKILKELESLLEKSDELILATDEDREGESISWHLKEVLKPKVPVKRMVFHEITKEAITEALKSPRKVDQNIVNAQETRRIIDRLFGYTLSPLLWKKIAVGLSAGRVQSVAVRLIVNREKERRLFKKSLYWDLLANFKTFEATLDQINDSKIATGTSFDESTGNLKEGSKAILIDEKKAEELKKRLEKSEYVVSDIKESVQARYPYGPFITSSLQIEANRKFGYSAKQTMQVAQKLYEAGLITYMRTDSYNLSSQAVSAIRKSVETRYGKEFVYESVRMFGKKKGAQEAHEAIRPAGTEMKSADELGLSGEQHKLYDLIWKRAMATQMKDASVKVVNLSIKTTSKGEEFIFKASGRRILFAGFLRAYVEGSDNPDESLDDSEKILPELKVGQVLDLKSLEGKSHETKPPSRYTDATLVKKLEAEGIGRPSTYASIISTIVDRGYVFKKANQLIPTFTAFAVTTLLEKYFSEYVDLSFTANMEESLDKIETNEIEYLPYLRKFYEGSKGIAAMVEKNLGVIDAKEMCTVKLPGFKYDVRVGRYGAYIETDQKDDKGDSVKVSLDQNVMPADLNMENLAEIIEAKKKANMPLGKDPVSGLEVFMLVGRYGPYVKLGTEQKSKMTSIPPTIPLDSMELKLALKLLELPKTLGVDKMGNEVKVGIGRFGPYILIDSKFRSIPKSYDFLNIELKEALEVFNRPKGIFRGRKRK